MRRTLTAFLILAVTSTAEAEWKSRTYTGGFSTHWDTVGHHGHDQELCAGGGERWTEFDGGRVILVQYIPCDDDDFSRANLDDSFGSQLGFERVHPLAPGLDFVGAVEASINHTEYNLSQRDFAVVSASAIAGLETGWKGFNAGIRYGVGPSWYDTRFSTRQFTEFSLTIPVSQRLGIRISKRHSDVTDRKDSIFGQQGPRIANLDETSLALVATHGESGERDWELSTSTGLTTPGALTGRRLSLGPAAFHQFALARPWRAGSPTTLHLSWTVTEHESLRESEFLGFHGNYRGKSVNTFGAFLTRNAPVWRTVSIQYGGGVEGGSFADDHHLLVDEQGNELRVGFDGALTARGTVRMQLGRGLAVEAGVQQVQWLVSGLGETRTIFGLVLNR